ncbi:MAG: spheroidene monooxygenase [Rubrivivax sp.]
MWREALTPPAAGPAPASGGGPVAAAQALPGVMMLLLMQWRTAWVPWGLSRLALRSFAIGRAPGMRFARVLGSGRDGGFGLVPSVHRQGLVAFFDDLDQAQAFAYGNAGVQRCRERAQESWLGLMRATSARGSWAGVGLAPSLVPVSGAPVAALTRASIRPGSAARFWSHSPPAQAGLAQARGCRVAVGLGEAPVLRQATFSLWDDQAAMDAYARSGAHAQAIRGAWREGWFAESMFARLVLVASDGQWHGRRVDAG